jgi:glucan-binding YG repeat protein
MMNFRIAAFFPSVVLGLCLAFTPIHQADAKEAPAKVELKKSKTKAGYRFKKDKKSDKQKVAKKDKKTDTKKVAKNKKETKAKIAHAKQDKNRPKTHRRSSLYL